MFGSLKLGKFFGIDTYIHGTFWLLPLLVLVQGSGSDLDEVAFDLLFLFAVFFCVALHEVGHALAARAYGIGTRDITLYPIGGVASLERMPERPWREVAVALAGPAVNVALAAGLFLGVVASDLAQPWDPDPSTTTAFLTRLVYANLFLCAFNLLPAFPMDGGRVLRAFLASRMDRVRATDIAVRVGTVVAGMFLVGGIVRQTPTLVVIAVAVWLLGQAELAAVRLRAAARRHGFFRSPEPDWEPTPAARPFPVDPADDLAARRFSGLAWDRNRSVWVQWANGVPVRDLPT
jgi:Zn-dependent protease